MVSLKDTHHHRRQRRSSSLVGSLAFPACQLLSRCVLQIRSTSSSFERAPPRGDAASGRGAMLQSTGVDKGVSRVEEETTCGEEESIKLRVNMGRGHGLSILKQESPPDFLLCFLQLLSLATLRTLTLPLMGLFSPMARADR